MALQNAINASPTQYNTQVWGASSLSNISPDTSGKLLKSNGVSAAPTYQAYPTLTLSVTTQVFTSSGTYTPTTGMRWCEVLVFGGGGAGGAVTSITLGTASSGSGGSGGGFARGIYYNTTIGASQTVTIGAGGNGAGGGTTSLGALLSGTGGAVGINGSLSPGFTFTSGVASGNGSGGNVQGRGAPSQFGISLGTGLLETNGAALGGFGGWGGYGGNARSSAVVGTTGSSNGGAGTNYASAGSGGYALNTSSTATGGNGSAGVVIITEWCFT